MSDTNLAVTDNLIEVWRDLYIGLADVINKPGFAEILGAVRKRESPADLHQMVWDAAVRDAGARSNPGYGFLVAASKGQPFDYESYRDSVTEERDIRLGGILYSWTRAEEQFGGRLRMFGAIRRIEQNAYDRIVDEIFARTAHVRC